MAARQGPKGRESVPSAALRTLTAADADAVYSLLSDQRVIRYMLFPHFDRARAQRFTERFASTEPTGSPPQVVFGVIEPGSDSAVGLCGLVLDGSRQQGEAWYLLSPSSWGKGLATSAVRQLVAHGFEALHLHRIWASCLPENDASSRVLQRLAFRHEGSHRQNLFIQGQWRDSETFALLASDWMTPLDLP